MFELHHQGKLKMPIMAMDFRSLAAYVRSYLDQRSDIVAENEATTSIRTMVFSIVKNSSFP